MQKTKYLLRRSAAFIVDCLVLKSVYLLNDQIIAMCRHYLLESGVNIITNPEIVSTMVYVHLALQIAVTLSYFTLCDGLLIKASIGKLMTRLRVTHSSGRLSFGNSMLRSAVKVLPLLMIMVLVQVMHHSKWYAIQLAGLDLATFGMLIIAVVAAFIYGGVLANKKGRMLHDWISKTAVVKI